MFVFVPHITDDGVVHIIPAHFGRDGGSHAPQGHYRHVDRAGAEIGGHAAAGCGHVQPRPDRCGDRFLHQDHPADIRRRHGFDHRALLHLRHGRRHADGRTRLEHLIRTDFAHHIFEHPFRDVVVGYDAFGHRSDHLDGGGGPSLHGVCLPAAGDQAAARFVDGQYGRLPQQNAASSRGDHHLGGSQVDSQLHTRHIRHLPCRKIRVFV